MDAAVRDFLKALLHASSLMGRDHPNRRDVKQAQAALADAAGSMTASADEVALTLAGDALFLDSTMLPHTTIEFNGLVAEMRHSGIDSITVARHADPQDLADLAAVIGGASSDLPAGGTVRLNERPMAGSDLHDSSMSVMRRTYAASLETLRSISSGDRLETSRVGQVIEGFLGRDPVPALMMATVRNHDETTFYHSVNVCLLSLVLAEAIGLSDEDLRDLGAGALLHDLGRVLLEEPALKKAGSLSSEEWAQVRLHPQEGALAILAGTGPGVEIAAAIALEHHAQVDGKGYPDLNGRVLHPFSRIVAVADSYDAVTSHRPHRPARTPGEAVRILSDGAGTQFDGEVVAALLRVMGEHPPGSLLRIGSGEVVMVTEAAAASSFNGLIVRDADGRDLPAPEPVAVDRGDVRDELLADEMGISPAQLLEAIEA